MDEPEQRDEALAAAIDQSVRVPLRRGNAIKHALVVSVAVFIGVVAASSFGDPEHSWWRDPISYFGSNDAPAPTAYALSLVVVGAMTAAFARTATDGWISAGLTIVGVSAGLLALVPIDCSPVDDACQVIIEAGADSVRHDLHGIVGLLFHVAVLGTAFAAAARSRRDSPALRIGRLVAASASVLPVVAVLMSPFSAGLGLVQTVALAALAGLVSTSRSSPLAHAKGVRSRSHKSILGGITC